MSFFPLKEPTYKGVIDLPNANTKYYKHYAYKHYIYNEHEDDIVEKLTSEDVDINKYNLSELKDIAEKLKIPNFNKMNKPDLIKFIKLKIKK